ncbi:ferritin [Hexamita inflata]|uniref:Ferritin n=1 Tax=Hexamita inflata TaxID=28002 RepID=A0AA86PH13_9EUKA|nr:ferritin [Hexamita inflata]
MNLLASNEMNAFLGYQQLALIAKANAFDELAAFFAREAQDELTHYNALADYCINCKLEITFKLCECAFSCSTVRELLELAHTLEKKIGEGINAAYSISSRADQIFLDQFVLKQVNEVAKYERLLMREKLLGAVFLSTLK